LDFLSENRNFLFCTGDTDYGCGVIRQDASLPVLQRLARRASKMIACDDRGRLVRQWMRAGNDYDATFELLQAHSKPLLNLVTVDEFLTGERNGSPVLR
jgi:hypothetical protein